MLYTLFIIVTIIITGLFVFLIKFNGGSNLVLWLIPLELVGAYIVTVLLFLVFIYLLSIFSRPAKGLSRPRSYQKKVTQEVCSYVLKMSRVVPVIKHPELLPTDSEFMLTCNHQSLLDPIAVIWAFKDHDITFVMKKEVLNIPIIGRWLKGAGFLPIDRQSARNAVGTIKTAAERIENNVNSIGIFPEGTRSHGPNVGSFKHGSFKIAMWSKKPIVVCAIDNAYKIKYHSIFRKTKVLLEVVKVLYYDDYKDMDTSEIAEYCKKLTIDAQTKRREQYNWLKEQTEKELENETIIGSFKNIINKKRNY